VRVCMRVIDVYTRTYAETYEDYDIVVLNESKRFRVGFAETQGV
jgi:hypothetical protein